jgi:ankyrin repeat protein
MKFFILIKISAKLSSYRSDLIELLVENGGDIKVKDNIGKNAIETAAFYAQEKLLPYLKTFNI